MNLKYLIDNIKKDKGAMEDGWINFDVLGENLGLEYHEYSDKDGSKNDKLRRYFLAPWLCTDTWVGIRVYFFDNEFACVTYQDARKSSEEVRGWISKEMADKVKQYIKGILVIYFLGRCITMTS